MEKIVEKVRNLVDDLLNAAGRQEFDFLSISSSKVFTLSESNVTASTVKVYKNGSLWSTDNYTFDSATNQIIVEEESGEELEVGDTLLVIFSFYKKYSDTEIEAYIKAAIICLSVEQYKTFTISESDLIFPTPTEIEENLIAVVASILMQGGIQQYRTPELSITFQDSDSKEVRITKLIKKYKKTYGILEYIDPKATTVDDNEDEIDG
jgi:hypothetical protein